MYLQKWPTCLVLAVAVPLLALVSAVIGAEDYNIQQNDGSYEYGYENVDSFHHSKATSRNVVRGEFGGRNPKTGGIDVTSYTAGPRGYRPRGNQIARKFDQSQTRGGPIGSRDDPYFDPNEDPSYDFQFKTRTYQRQESANRLSDVKGKYSYVDDVGERHNVEYIAGKNTGFHVKTPFPDSNPRAYGPLFYNGRGRPIPRGRTSIQRGLDGSYRFVATGPDQRRTEVADAQGNTRGSYTYLDDKGTQHSVHYIAGPGIGYRVLKNVKGPHLPSVYPFNSPNIIAPDFYNYIDKHSQGDTFNAPETGATGSGGTGDYEGDYGSDGGYTYGPTPRPRPNRPRPKPSGAVPRPRPTPGPGPSFGDRPTFTRPTYDYDGGDDEGNLDLFGGSSSSPGVGSTTSGPPSSTGRPTTVSFPSDDDDLGSSPTGGGTAIGGDGGGGGTDDGDYDDSDLFGGRPSTGSSPRPSSSRPSSRPTQAPQPSSSSRPVARPTYDDEDDGNDLDDGLFGSPGPGAGVSSSNLGSGSTPRPPVLSITGTGGKKTIVTNLGDKIFTVPPGVSVHAHVQSIDLYPYESKVPSPADQFRSETTHAFQRLTTRQVNKNESAESESVTKVAKSSNVTTEVDSDTTTTEVPTTAAPATTTTKKSTIRTKANRKIIK